MKKMKTVFVMDYSTRPARITRDVQEQWVIDGEGVATIKVDGTSCMVQGGKLFKRFDAKAGRQIPDGFIPCEKERDPHTGHYPGWVPVGDEPDSKYHREAFDKGEFDDGTYELIGPKVQKDRYGSKQHVLRRHGDEIVEVERTFEGMRDWLEMHDVEGIVFHHPDGRMSKIRRKDFGFEW